MGGGIYGLMQLILPALKIDDIGFSKSRRKRNSPAPQRTKHAPLLLAHPHHANTAPLEDNILLYTCTISHRVQSSYVLLAALDVQSRRA